MNAAMALRGALVMIVVGSALGLAHNALSPEPVPWKTVAKTTLSLDALSPEDPGASAPDPSAAETEVTPPAAETEVTPEKDPSVTEPPATQPADEIESHPPAESAGEVAAEPPTTKSTDEVEPEPAATETAGEIESDPPSDAGDEHADIPETDIGDKYADIPEAQFPFEVSLERAKSLYDRGGLLVLDAREHHEYAEGHIKGAQSAPFDIMVGDIEWLDRTAADPRPLLVYCDGTDCEISLNLGFEVSQNGHPRVLILEGGFRGWAEAGYPTTTGDQP